MAVIATDTPRFSNVVKGELWPELSYCRAVVTVNDSAATLTVGTVLGKVTVDGKYKVAVETAIDGSEVADAIVIQEVTVPASTDTNVLVLLKGPAVVTVNDAAATLKVGTVLGKVTVSGKYKVAVETATDGSKVADAIVIQEVTVPASTDTNVLVLLKGPAVVSKGGLTLDASYNDNTKKNAVYAALEAKGIKVIETV